MCEYCEGEKFLLNTRKTAGDGFEIWIEDGELHIYANINKADVFTASDSTKVKIKYCPICGRAIDDTPMGT